MSVYLVGAGPGDPGLLTVRGASLLGRAEVVVHDRLASPELLALAPPAAERIDVGKRPGRPVDQGEINRLLVREGRAGRLVVRLKGGDPFVFGRGGEEALALEEAGVAYEVVPGVTSAVAAPAYAGVPVTHRGLSTSFTVVTGHSRRAGEAEVDWESLAGVGGTVVVLMGVAHRAEIAARLVAGGRDPATPVVVVRWGSQPAQEVIRTSLAELGEVRVEAPATMVIGPVAGLDLGWFARRPLTGWRVVVVRAREQAPELVAALAAAGAEAIPVPVIEVVPPADGGAALAAAAARVREYDWVVFTSANAVSRFVPLLRDARDFGSARVAAIGPGTARALAAHGVAPDLVPETYVAEALVASFPPAPSGGGRVLVPRAAAARPVLPEGLRGAGWEVEVVTAYRTEHPRPSPEALARAAGAHAICFTASSTVAGWVRVAGGLVPPLVACIGPVTAAEAAARGLRVDVVAGRHTIEGLVAALVDAAGGKVLADPGIPRGPGGGGGAPHPGGANTGPAPRA
ncbi:MAG TPA: uroporphyrinogen-III C-methyltransferase [Acidimicrobiales bacterium]|nr:uroporphyrinogen-III C-methyltransferase [Acidimicrobiales bacterium]